MRSGSTCFSISRPNPPRMNISRKTIRQTKTPVFVSYTNSVKHVNEDQLAYMNDFVPANLRADADALLPNSFDRTTVRWIFPADPGMPLGFARKAISLVGMQTPERKLEIAWRPKPDMQTSPFPNMQTSPFPIFRSQDVPVLPDELFKGKIVLIGEDVPSEDRHRTPLAVSSSGEGTMAGVVIWAHAISQLLDGRNVRHVTPAEGVAITMLFALIGSWLGLLKHGVAFNLAASAVILALYWAFAMFGYSHGVPLVPLVGPTLAFVISFLPMVVIIGRGERKQREFIQGAFSRYVSPAVVDQLVDDPRALSVTGSRREVTFIFTDIVSFTTFSEKFSSETVSEVLNAYLDGACAIILRYQGTIDKFIGDAIMAIFNAPINQDDHAERAVKCALELDDYCEKFRITQNEAGIPIGATQIGVHTGPATIGNFGSSSRMEFSALGDAVNIASRCQGVNKYFGTRVCVSQDTVDQCPNVRFRKIGDALLKGKKQFVGLYSPISAAEEATSLPREYEEAYSLLKSGDAKARRAFLDLREKYPDDAIIAFHCQQIEGGKVSPQIVLENK